MSHGTFHWNELLTNDVDGARTFFADTLGWTYDEMPMGTMVYYVAKVDERPVGGIMKMPKDMPEGTPPHWMSYIAVDDVDARVAKAKAAGGEILSGPIDVAGIGRIFIVRDPAGAVAGWITPADMG